MRKPSRFSALLIGAVAAILATTPVAAATTVGLADVLATDGYFAAGAVDSQGISHVIFLRYTQSGLWYATDSSGHWVTSRISTQTGWTEPALAIDGQRKLHVAIGNEGSSPGIHYLTNRTGAWADVRLLLNSYDRGPEIAVDPLGEAHVVVKETGSEEANYFTNRRGLWIGRHLTACTTMESIALDTQRRVHIACGGAPGVDPGIFHLTDVTGAWKAERVTTGSHQEPIISTGGGGLRIAFEAISAGVYVTTRGASSWGTPSKVNSTALYLSSFIVDPSAKSHLIVRGNASSYATNASGSWVSKPAPEGSISRDGLGKLHILGGNIALVHQVIGSPGLTRTGIGTNASYDTAHPSLAIDAAGLSHVAYWMPFAADPGIRYGTFNGSSWSGGKVRSGDGQDPVLAVQPDGTVHLAYVAAGGAELWYGRRSAGAWTWTMLSQPSAHYECPAIAVSSTGHAYVSVTRETSSGGFVYIRAVLMTDRTGSWVTAVLPTTTHPECTSVAANSADKAYVAYLSGGKPLLETDVSGSFVGSGFGAGGDTHPQVALDGTGKVYVAFTRPGNYDSASVGVFLRTNASGSWTQSTVSRLADAAGALSLDVRSDGKVAIAFDGFMWSPYVYLATNRSGTWVTTQAQDPVRRTLDVAFAPDGKLRFVQPEYGVGFAELRE